MGKRLPNRKRNGTYVDPDGDKDDKNHPKSAADKEDEKERESRMKKKDADGDAKAVENRENMTDREKEIDEER